MRRAFDLTWKTPVGWAEAALAEPFALLSDHAHCELGATVSAQGMIARYPEHAKLVERMTALAIEELRHFGQVFRLLRSLGGMLEPVRTNPYADKLVRATRGSETLLLDRLLVSAVIERRSLERFELLAEAALRRPEGANPELARLYGELAPSEAGHAQLFVELAQAFHPAETVDRRLAYWLGEEARLVRALPFEPRVHSGPPGVAAALDRRGG